MGDTDSTSENAGELLRRLQESHDPRLLGRIVDLTVGYVYGAAYWVTRDHDDADDVTQEVFLTLTRQYRHIRDTGKLHRWLKKVTIRLAWKARAGAARKGPPDLLHDLLRRLSDREENPLDQIVGAEQRVRLEQALDAAFQTLTPAERRCVETVWMEGHGAPDAAKKMGVKVETVYSHCSRAFKKLSSFERLREWL